MYAKNDFKTTLAPILAEKKVTKLGKLCIRCVQLVYPHIGGLGFCYGSWPVIKLAADGKVLSRIPLAAVTEIILSEQLKAAAGAHPSHHRLLGMEVHSQMAEC